VDPGLGEAGEGVVAEPVMIPSFDWTSPDGSSGSPSFGGDGTGVGSPEI